MVKMAYSVALAASGGNAPIAWSLTGGNLPPGLTLSSGGKLSGTPMQTGTFTFTIKASDASSPQQVKSVASSIKVACYDPDHDGDCNDK
jgi:hypothetical protein